MDRPLRTFMAHSVPVTTTDELVALASNVVHTARDDGSTPTKLLGSETDAVIDKTTAVPQLVHCLSSFARVTGKLSLPTTTVMRES